MPPRGSKKVASKPIINIESDEENDLAISNINKKNKKAQKSPQKKATKRKLPETKIKVLANSNKYEFEVKSNDEKEPSESSEEENANLTARKTNSENNTFCAQKASQFSLEMLKQFQSNALTEKEEKIAELMKRIEKLEADKNPKTNCEDRLFDSLPPLNNQPESSSIIHLDNTEVEQKLKDFDINKFLNVMSISKSPTILATNLLELFFKPTRQGL